MNTKLVNAAFRTQANKLRVGTFPDFAEIIFNKLSFGENNPDALILNQSNWVNPDGETYTNIEFTAPAPGATLLISLRSDATVFEELTRSSEEPPEETYPAFERVELTGAHLKGYPAGATEPTLIATHNAENGLWESARTRQDKFTDVVISPE